MMNISAQTTGRIIHLNFPRYGTSDADQQHYYNAVTGLLKISPFQPSFEIATNCKYFQQRTAGCIGSFSKWLVRAIDAANWDGRNQISEDDFRRTSLSDAQLAVMEREILDFESFAKVSSGSLLFENDPPSDLEALARTAGQSKAPVSESGKSMRTRPGQRNPVRDPVGDLS